MQEDDLSPRVVQVETVQKPPKQNKHISTVKEIPQELPFQMAENGNEFDKQPDEEAKKPETESKKTFFEQIWEKNHPEEIKKMKLAKKQAEIQAKAKELEAEALKLNMKALTLNKTLHGDHNKTVPQNITKPVEKPIEKEKTAEELLNEGKSLAEVQRILQMRKPYYQQQMAEEQKIKEQQELKELEQMTKDAFRDPMQELVDKYANAAEQRAKAVEGTRLMEELSKNQTNQNTTNLE